MYYQCLTNVSVFLGQNNSGKSSILEAIFLPTGSHNPQTLLRIDLLRSLVYNEPNDLRHFFYKLDYASKTELKGEMYGEMHTRTVTIIPKKESRINKITLSSIRNTPSSSTTTYQTPFNDSYLLHLKIKYKKK